MKQSSTLHSHYQFRVSLKVYRHMPMPLVTFLMAYSNSLWVAKTALLGTRYITLN